MRRDDRGRHRHLQDGTGGETDLRADAGAEMGHRHGGLCLNRWHVSLLRGPPGTRSTPSRRRLRVGLSTTSGSAARGLDEASGKDFRGTIVHGPEARGGEEAGPRIGMTAPELLNSLSQLFGAELLEKTEFRGEPTRTTAPADLREV